MLEAIQFNIQRRTLQQEFVARGLATRDKARRSGKYVSSGEVLAEIDIGFVGLRDKAANPTYMTHCRKILECGGKTPLFPTRDMSRQSQSGDTSPHSKGVSQARGMPHEFPATPLPSRLTSHLRQARAGEGEEAAADTLESHTLGAVLAAVDYHQLAYARAGNAGQEPGAYLTALRGIKGIGAVMILIKIAGRVDGGKSGMRARLDIFCAFTQVSDQKKGIRSGYPVSEIACSLKNLGSL